MKRLLFLTFVFALIIAQQVHAENTTCIYEFYGEGCPHCARLESYLYNLQQDYPNLEIKRFEIYNNISNRDLLMDYFDAYGIEKENGGIPVVFIGESYFIGDQPAIDGLENKIKEFGSVNCPDLNMINGTGTSGPSSSTDFMSIEFLSLIIGAAIVDSINPCAIAVLLILLGSLMMSTDKKRALKAGLAFTISIYIVYFLFGLGLFSVIQVSGMSFWFYKVIGFLAILIGLLNLKDYFWYGSLGFKMEIPMSWRPTLNSMLSKVTSPLGAFIMGFAVCLFELPCTGGPYLFVLSLLAEKTTQMVAIPILLLYNLVFILPLLLITAILYFEKSSVEKVSVWKEKNIRPLHLIAGILMVVLGIAVVIGIV